MRFSENITNNTNLFIDECESTSSPSKNSHSSIQYPSSILEHISHTEDKNSSPSSDCNYTEFVKAIGKSNHVDGAHLSKRTSWSSAGPYDYGLPPTGKRTESNKTSSRIRLRPQNLRNSQSQQVSLVRPVSFNEKYDRIRFDRLSNQSLNRNGSLSNLRCEPSPTSSSSSIDTILQITTRASPSVDNGDFISDTSSLSSVTTTNTITSSPSTIYAQRKSSICDQLGQPITRPLLSEYQQKDLSHIDYKLSSPVLQTNTDSLSSPISSLRPSTTSFLSSSFTCPKGHEESSPSPKGSSLNQYTGFTSQTLTIDSSRDDISQPTTTTRSMMTMSILPNHHHHQIYPMNPLNTSIPSTTNHNDRLNQQQDQIESTIVSGGCLKTNKLVSNSKKKSVHFDWHSPTEIGSSSPPARNNYQLPVTVTSSYVFTSNSDNDEQKRKNHGETIEEKEKNETTRRTIITAIPLTTNTVHRSFSLSPSPPSKKENNDSRSSRQEKKENVDELNCTTSRRGTTATTHLYCPPNTTTVTLNDGSCNISSNGTNNSNTSEHLIYSSIDKHISSNNLLMKASAVNPQTTTKRFIGNGGFLSFINRSNSTNNKSSPTDENKHLRRTSSTQRKSKQHVTYENKRLSADIESLHSSSSIPSSHTRKGDIDKVIINRPKERQSTTDNNANTNTSYDIDPSIPQYTNTNTNRNSVSMSMNSTTTTIKSNIGDSLNNGLLFQPVQSTKKEPFFLSPPKVLSNHDEPSSLIGKTMQTSTLIISTPPQYHYYLYPPSSSSAISKKTSTTNRTISNVSMNSISTNSSSSSSYESQIHDLDDDTFSHSPNPVQNHYRISRSRPSSDTKPVILSDSVQAFWPPRSSFVHNSDLEQIKKMVATVEQNKHANLINLKYKQCESNPIKNNMISSTHNNDSLPINNGNQTLSLPPTTSLMLNNNEEVRSYSEQSSFSNSGLQTAGDSSLEDSQASYSERLREKSRLITTNRSLAMNVNNSSLSRSRSKDALNNQIENSDSTNTNILLLKSAGQQALSSIVRQELTNDFQSKRQFFENRTYTDHSPVSTNNKIYTLPPANPTVNNSNQQRHITKPPPSSDSLIRTTKYFDSSSNQASLPPTVYRKPVRIVKAVQRSAPSPPINEVKPSLPTKMNNTTDDFKALSLHYSDESIMNNDHHLSSEYVRDLFPIPDHLKRNRSRQNSSSNTNADGRAVFTDNVRPTDDLLFNLTKRLETLKENQRAINDEIESNTALGTKLINIIESKGESNEIEKFKLHINEIDTITSVLLKLSSRLAKVENDLLMITDDSDPTKASLLERREKIQQKHDEAKSLKDGIDRRSRLVTNLLQKYFSDQESDEYDHFIRMKSTLVIDAKDIEENIALIQKQIQILLHTSSSAAAAFVNNQQYSSTPSVSLVENLHQSNSTTTSSSSSNNVDNIQTNYYNPISSTA